jgi:hypothetical protein
MLNRNAGIALSMLFAHALALSACGHDALSSSPAAATLVTPPPPPPVPGTILMKGTVSDTAFRHVTGAKIEVLNGPQGGMTTTSNERGEFTLIGVFDDATRFRASKDGFAIAELPLGAFCERCNPTRWVNFSLQVLTAPVDISGNYSMTVAVDSVCTQMPAPLRSRTYTVQIPLSGSSPANAYFAVYPTGADFVKGWDRFDGGVSGNDVGFWFESLVEQISPNSYLIIGVYASGTAIASGTSTIATVASGSIDFCTLNPGSGVMEDCFRSATAVHARCNTSRHALTFTRR